MILSTCQSLAQCSQFKQVIWIVLQALQTKVGLQYIWHDEMELTHQHMKLHTLFQILFCLLLSSVHIQMYEEWLIRFWLKIEKRIKCLKLIIFVAFLFWVIEKWTSYGPLSVLYLNSASHLFTRLLERGTLNQCCLHVLVSLDELLSQRQK